MGFLAVLKDLTLLPPNLAFKYALSLGREKMWRELLPQNLVVPLGSRNTLSCLHREAAEHCGCKARVPGSDCWSLLLANHVNLIKVFSFSEVRVNNTTFYREL